MDKWTGKYVKTIWRAKFGAANYTFDTRVYNKAVLEVSATEACQNVIGLKWLG